MKRVLFLASLLSLFLINFASAQYYGSLGNILNSVDESTIVLGLAFVIIFAMVNFAMSKFFRENKGVAGAISIAVSLLAIWGLNRSGFGYTNLFYNFFFFLPTGFIETAWPILFLVLGVLLIIKYKFWKGVGILFLGSGGLLIFLSFIRVIEQSGGWALGITLAGIGAILFFVGLSKAEKRKKIEISSSDW